MATRQEGAGAPARTSGQIIAGRYQLVEQLGRGGMGTVWRAHHCELASDVALKFLDDHMLDEDPEHAERFAREARSAAAVRSSNVIQIFDYGVEGATPYIVMELLEGKTLRAHLDAVGALNPTALERIFSQIARALSNAHELGVVHRDIKPQNIFLASEGPHQVVKVIDFGIAKLTGGLGDLGTKTQTGVALGTPQYMSPEQACGQRDVDHRSDLWSLGVMAFEALTGQLPFAGPSLGELMLQICTEDPPRPSHLADVPVGFDEWFAKAVQREPKRRFESAEEMDSALQRVLHERKSDAAATLSGLGTQASVAVPARYKPGSEEDEARPSSLLSAETRRWLTTPHAAIAASAAAVALAVYSGPLVSPLREASPNLAVSTNEASLRPAAGVALSAQAEQQRVHTGTATSAAENHDANPLATPVQAADAGTMLERLDAQGASRPGMRASKFAAPRSSSPPSPSSRSRSSHSVAPQSAAPHAAPPTPTATERRPNAEGSVQPRPRRYPSSPRRSPSADRDPFAERL